MKTFKAILVGVSGAFLVAAAHAEMVVVVSAKNPTAVMTIDNAEKIFLGKIKLFPDGTSAIPLDLPKGADKDIFYERVTGKTATQLKAYWAKIVFTGSGAPPKEVESPADMIKLVAQNPNTVGYVDKSLVDKSVKVVLQLP